ncbi:MAG: DUF2934 domain-containing protein [Acidobacteria bacterium]|nr:DUF2934 domain-containing protein [Acidobacteriota bacterium]
MARKLTPLESPAAETPKPQHALSEERIRVRAYELYEKRQGSPGDAETDWFHAEAEFAESLAKQAR